MSRVINLLKEHRWLALIALLSLVLKLAFFIQGGLVNPDAATYIAAAEKYSQGLFREGMRYYKMPFYPLILAGTHLIVPDWILAGRLLSIGSLWLSLFPLYGITHRLFCHSAALWTACLFAVLPVFNGSGMDIKRDPLFLFFALCALWLLVVFVQDNKFRFYVGFLVLSALAMMTRIEGCLLFFISPIPLLLSLKNNTVSRSKKVIGGIVVVVAVVVVVWWANSSGFARSLRLHEISAWLKGFLSFKFFQGYQGLLQAIKDLQKTLPGARLSNNLLEVTRHYAPLVYCLGLLETLLKAIFPTSLLALWALRWRSSEEKKMTQERWLIVLVWVGFALLNLLYLFKRNFIQERYFWVPIVLTLPWVGYGMTLLWQKTVQRKIIATVAIVLVLFAPLVKTLVVASEPQDDTLIKAGAWLRQHDPEQKIKILFNDRRLALYADRVEDVKKTVRAKNLNKPNYLKKRLRKVDLVVLYLSQEKGEVLLGESFEILKSFRGESKNIFILKRKNSSD